MNCLDACIVFQKTWRGRQGRRRFAELLVDSEQEVDREESRILNRRALLQSLNEPEEEEEENLVDLEVIELSRRLLVEKRLLHRLNELHRWQQCQSQESLARIALLSQFLSGIQQLQCAQEESRARVALCTISGLSVLFTASLKHYSLMQALCFAEMAHRATLSRTHLHLAASWPSQLIFVSETHTRFAIEIQAMSRFPQWHRLHLWIAFTTHHLSLLEAQHHALQEAHYFSWARQLHVWQLAFQEALSRHEGALGALASTSEILRCELCNREQLAWLCIVTNAINGNETDSRDTFVCTETVQRLEVRELFHRTTLSLTQSSVWSTMEIAFRAHKAQLTDLFLSAMLNMTTEQLLAPTSISAQHPITPKPQQQQEPESDLTDTCSNPWPVVDDSDAFGDPGDLSVSFMLLPTSARGGIGRGVLASTLETEGPLLPSATTELPWRQKLSTSLNVTRTLKSNVTITDSELRSLVKQSSITKPAQVQPKHPTWNRMSKPSLPCEGKDTPCPSSMAIVGRNPSLSPSVSTPVKSPLWTPKPEPPNPTVPEPPVPRSPSWKKTAAPKRALPEIMKNTHNTDELSSLLQAHAQQVARGRVQELEWLHATQLTPKVAGVRSLKELRPDSSNCRD
eukprot:NODE_613_length_2017_cov_26.164021_g570_i0.p1 GENE.NODE_613_length_2017_cov_26.164021_g570_i0~~NODE_613_length_2017_cov_26.164021_g570_i0.p1  ORF type:complete len:648 (-),score=134.34 NODE_613_length_2017_cov_26.164021_g570_i0:74-1954(-)